MAKKQQPEVIEVFPGGPYMNEWVDVEEAAAYLKITPRSVYESIRRGQLTCYRLGRKIRFKRGQIDREFKKSMTIDDLMDDEN